MDQGGRKANELHSKLVLLTLPKPIAKKSDQQQKEGEEMDDTASFKSAKSSKGKSPSSNASSPSSGKDFGQGLEKAVADKDRLLDYQKNRYVCGYFDYFLLYSKYRLDAHIINRHLDSM